LLPIYFGRIRTDVKVKEIIFSEESGRTVQGRQQFRTLFDRK